MTSNSNRAWSVREVGYKYPSTTIRLALIASNASSLTLPHRSHVERRHPTFQPSPPFFLGPPPHRRSSVLISHSYDMDPFEMYAIVAAGIFLLLLIAASFVIRSRSRIRKAEQETSFSTVTTTPTFKPEVVAFPRDAFPVSRSPYPANNQLPLVSRP